MLDPRDLRADAWSASPRRRPSVGCSQRRRWGRSGRSTRRRSWSSHRMSMSCTSARRITSTSRSPQAALAAGKHVICEKPLAVDDRGAEELVEAAASAGKMTAVPFVYRYYPTVQEARERIRSGATGPVRLIHGGYLQDWLLRPSDDNWRVDEQLGGASRAFADIGSHWCDLVEHVSGHRITRLCARTFLSVPERVTEDAVSFQFETDRGARRQRARQPDLRRAQEPPVVRDRLRRGRAELRPGGARDALDRRARARDAAQARPGHALGPGRAAGHDPRGPSAGLQRLLRRLRRRRVRRGGHRRGARRAADFP